jgi:hypothetical protein
MKLFEISAEIERLKNLRATTPAVASYSGSKNTTNIGSSVADVKEAKEKGFPTRPEKAEKPKVSKGVIQKEKKSDMKPVVEKKKMTVKKSEEKPVKKMAKKMKKVEVAESESDYE